MITSHLGSEYAGLRIRFLAQFLDGILSLTLILLVILPIWLYVDPSTVGERLFFVFLIFLLALSYHVLFWFFYQATPGKMFCRLKVVDIRTERAPSLMQCIIRFFGYYVSQIYSMGYIAAMFDSRNQTWHDRMADTVVIKLND